MLYNSQNIADRIRERAKQQGKTLRTLLLSECGLSINTISHIGSGHDITTLHFAKIADALDCSVDYLLGRTDQPEINRYTTLTNVL